MTEIVVVRDADSIRLLSFHDFRDRGLVHDDLRPSTCVCARTTVVSARPQQTGEVCASCGGMAVRTGTCTTCTECGTTGGCG